MFIKIKSKYISISDILSANEDFVRSEAYFEDLPEGGYRSGHRDIHYVRIMTREMIDGSSQDYLFKHDTPEAKAVLAWLEPRTTVLI